MSAFYISTIFRKNCLKKTKFFVMNEMNRLFQNLTKIGANPL